MPSEPTCDRVQAELADALVSRREPAAAALAHAAACEACGLEREAIARLEAELSALPELRASDALVSATRERATAALRAPRPDVPAPAGGTQPIPFPTGYRGDLARLVGGALLSLPFVLSWNAGVMYVGAGVLEGMLPGAWLTALGAGYGVAAAGWLSVIAASLPFLAHRRARRRMQEVAA